MIRLAAGPDATLADLRRAKTRRQLIRTELARVRAAARAWRNGLGGLLAALAGFSLVKGRSDLGELTRGWAVAVGLVLLGAAVAGTLSALTLLRAAHGRPSVVRVDEIPSREALDHDEALRTAVALRIGIVLALVCLVLLVAAVGMTWYGPAGQGQAHAAGLLSGPGQR
jgi:hypothetical protein